MRFALLLPLTSKGSSLESLKECASRISRLGEPDTLSVWIALDEDDSVFESSTVGNIFKDAGVQVSGIKVFQPSRPARICEMWRVLAKCAFEAGEDFFLLFGDDVFVTEGSISS